ncbi:MAG: glucose 1-dehydrogenase [Nitrososphaerales archaeon]|jgi:threonine dehydrogenase-like Zn-dependent dehydrogenase
MKAIVVTPKKQGSLRLEDLEEPKQGKNDVLLEVQKVGICGTDRDIIEGFYGEAPEGGDFLVLGHESLCRVAELESNVTGLRAGDLVVPTVRRDCWEHCLNCRSGESDMCLTGDYKEHGIKGLHGFARELAVSDGRYIAKLPESLAGTGVLLEPMTIVEKGLVQTYRVQEARMKWEPKRALVLGAGPVGLLATALLRLEGLEVHTVATRSEESLKARLVEETGAAYINAKEVALSRLEYKYDIVFEITGSTTLALEAQSLIGVNGIVSYLGIYKNEVAKEDAGRIFTNLVLGNQVHLGSVNANKSYFTRGAKDLLRISKKWHGLLGKMITKVSKPEDYEGAYGPENEEEIKSVIEFN